MVAVIGRMGNEDESDDCKVTEQRVQESQSEDEIKKQGEMIRHR